MLFPASETEVLDRHRELVRSAETYIRHFGPQRRARVVLTVVSYLSRLAKLVSVRLEHAVVALERTGGPVNTRATSC